MAERTKREIRADDVQGLKCLRKFGPLLSRLRKVGTACDKAGNRRLFIDQYCALILLALFSPAIKSLRDLQRVIALDTVRKRLGVTRASEAFIKTRKPPVTARAAASPARGVRCCAGSPERRVTIMAGGRRGPACGRIGAKGANAPVLEFLRDGGPTVPTTRAGCCFQISTVLRKRTWFHEVAR